MRECCETSEPRLAGCDLYNTVGSFLELLEGLRLACVSLHCKAKSQEHEAGRYVSVKLGTRVFHWYVHVPGFECLSLRAFKKAASWLLTLGPCEGCARPGCLTQLRTSGRVPGTVVKLLGVRLASCDLQDGQSICEKCHGLQCWAQYPQISCQGNKFVKKQALSFRSGLSPGRRVEERRTSVSNEA